MEQLETRKAEKKLAYSAPRLTIHGNVEKITLQQKFIGQADGVTYGPTNIPIGS